MIFSNAEKSLRLALPTNRTAEILHPNSLSNIISRRKCPGGNAPPGPHLILCSCKGDGLSGTVESVFELHVSPKF